MNRFIYAKTLLPLGIAVVAGLQLKSYLDEVYYRKQKFIRKLARSYFKSHDGVEQFTENLMGDVIAKSDGMDLYFGGMRKYISRKFTDPTAIIYVQKIESIKLILEKAAKYGFKVACLDVDSIQDYQKALSNKLNLSLQEMKRLTRQKNPFLIINLRKVKHIEYDPINQTVKTGVGNKVSEVNAYLAQYNRKIPFIASKNDRLFTVLSENTTPLDSLEFDNIGQIVTGLVAISPSSAQIVTPPNEMQDSLGIGLDLTKLFIGQQSRYGIIYEATLKTEEIRERHRDEIILDSRFVSKTNMFYLFDSLIQQQKGKRRFQLFYDRCTNQYRIILESLKKQDIKSTLDKFVNKYVHRQLWNNNEISVKNIKTYPLILKYQLSKRCMMDCFQQLKELQLKREDEQFQVTLDFKTGYLTIGISDDIKSTDVVSMAKTFTHFISNRKGRFIQCSDKLLNRMLKLETYPLELGLNSMKLEHKMAELVDKKGVMFTDFLLHREYEELKEVW